MTDGSQVCRRRNLLGWQDYGVAGLDGHGDLQLGRHAMVDFFAVLLALMGTVLLFRFRSILRGLC